jgi:hypothetical protein
MAMDDKRLAEIEDDIEKADNNVGAHCVFNLMTDTHELIAEIRAMKAREAEMLAALLWIVANPRAHPENVVRVAEEAIAKAEGRS